MSKKTKIPIPTRIKKLEDNNPRGLLQYFASCCNDIWGLGETLSAECNAIMPQRMAGFAKSNGISGIKYRAFVDYLINVFVSKDTPPSVEWLVSRALFMQFKQVEATLFAEASSNSTTSLIPRASTTDDISN